MRDLMALTAQPQVISLAGGLPDVSAFPAELLASLKTVERLARDSQDIGVIREKLAVIVEACKMAQKELEETLRNL